MQWQISLAEKCLRMTLHFPLQSHGQLLKQEGDFYVVRSDGEDVSPMNS